MKIKYNGMELETITEGFWPEGVTLVWCDEDDWDQGRFHDAVCLVRNRAITIGKQSGVHSHWAILPPKPAPRRLTYREVYRLWRRGWDFMRRDGFVQEPSYKYEIGNQPIEDGHKLRAPGSDEWVEPTSDLLEEK